MAALMLSSSAAFAELPATAAGIAAYNRGDFAAAFQVLSVASAAGDPEAQVNLGYLYARGHGVAPDSAEAFRLYELSAEGGSSEGMNALGFRFLHAPPSQQDIPMAAYWYCEAVLRGNPRAMNNLALMMEMGQVPYDEAEARSLWEQAADLGHANAMYNLGLSYINGIHRDAAKTDYWMLRAAMAGHLDAQAYMHARGHPGPFSGTMEPGQAMRLEPKDVTGKTRECGLYVS